MKIIRILFLVSLFFSIRTNGQKTITNARNIIVKNQNYGKGFLYLYDKDVNLIGGEICDFEKGSAEELFCNFFNLRDESKLSSFFKSGKIPNSYTKDNYLEKKGVYFQKTEKNYYELDSRYELIKSPFLKEIYIKYINHNENFPKPVYALFCLEEINGKLYVSDMGQALDLGLFLISTKSSVLLNFLENELSDEQLKILGSYYENEILNIELLVDDFFDLMKEDKNHPLFKLLHDEKYSLF